MHVVANIISAVTVMFAATDTQGPLCKRRHHSIPAAHRKVVIKFIVYLSSAHWCAV